MENCRIPGHIGSVTKKRRLRGTRYAVKAECKTGSYIFRWLRSTRYAVRTECKTGSYIFRWLRGTRYTVRTEDKTGSYIFCWLRGTRDAVPNEYAKQVSSSSWFSWKLCVPSLFENEIFGCHF